MASVDDNDDLVFRRAFSSSKTAKPALTGFLPARVLRATQHNEPRSKRQVWVQAAYGCGCCIVLEAFTGWNGQSLFLAPAAVTIWLARERILALFGPFLR